MSSGLYLSKILNSRDEMTFHENYGALLLTMAPLNCIVLPFALFALFKMPSTKANTTLTIFQYMVFIIIIYVGFLLGSVILLPFAFLRSAVLKGSWFIKASTLKERGFFLAQLLGYLTFGVPGLVLGLFSDSYYFIMNNFRSNLKKIII